ncbi:MAG: Rpn family recombination-promoting nuclease/putative transposase [Treponema sp.]|jgi:predicted transposase/invertase (TIGR01784 family)|nr:Rpn family recombination-promoting nuclease/putative transposase [Treponema sp.]
MTERFPSPISDYAFALLFGDQRHIEILTAFLKSVLDLPEDEYGHLTIVNPFLKRLRRKDKLGIVDVRVHTKSGRIIHVEIQVSPFTWMRNRIVFYIAKLLWSQLRSGGSYEEIHEVISIVICDYPLLPEEPGYLNEYSLRNAGSGKPFTDLIKIITLELPKLPEAPDDQKVWSWAKFFRVKTREELEAASAAAKGNRGLEMAVAEYKKLTWSERRQMIAEEREKARRDKIAMLHYARHEGREEGLTLGRMEGEARGMEKGEAIGEARGQQKLAALLKSGKTLDEALAILQAEAGSNNSGSQGE